MTCVFLFPNRCSSISSSTSSTCTFCCWPALSLWRSYAWVTSTPTGSLWYAAFHNLCWSISHFSNDVILLFRLTTVEFHKPCFEEWFSFQGLVLTITIIREAVDEIRCYIRDKEVNSQIYSKLSTRGRHGIPLSSTQIVEYCGWEMYFSGHSVLNSFFFFF